MGCQRVSQSDKLFYTLVLTIEDIDIMLNLVPSEEMPCKNPGILKFGLVVGEFVVFESKEFVVPFRIRIFKKFEMGQSLLFVNMRNSENYTFNKGLSQMYSELHDRIINLEKQNKRYRNIFTACVVLVCSVVSYGAYDETRYDRLRVKQLVVDEYILGVNDQGKPAQYFSSVDGHGNIQLAAPPFYTEENIGPVMVEIAASENGPYMVLKGYDGKLLMALEQVSTVDGHNTGLVTVFNNKDGGIAQMFTDPDGGKLFIANNKGIDSNNNQGAIDLYVDEMGKGHVVTNEAK